MYKQSQKCAWAYKVGITCMLLACAVRPIHADPVTLGQAATFRVLAGSAVTNSGTTVVFGDVGVSPGTSITGFPPGLVVNGTLHSNDALAQQAQIDLSTAYNVIAVETPTQNLTGQNLGGLTLTPGVYRFDTSAQLTGSLILDALGDPGARFDFQIGTTLTTASDSTITLTNGGRGDNVFFQVGTSATLGAGTLFAGNLLAAISITLGDNASILDGRALARTGGVTLKSNQIGSNALVPEPSLILFLGCAALPLIFALIRCRKRSHR